MLHNEWYIIMDSLSDHSYSGINNGTRVQYFLHGIESIKLVAVVNVVCAKPEKYGKDFDVMVSYLGQMVMKNGHNLQSVHITKSRIQPIKPKWQPSQST